MTLLSDKELVAELCKFTPLDKLDSDRVYFQENILRYRKVFNSISDGNGTSNILDIGGRLYTANIYKNILNFDEVTLVAKWQSAYTSPELLNKIPKHDNIHVAYADAEIDRLPYNDHHFDVVVCSEIIEHLAVDPMFMIAEINRVTRPGGLLILTTPNAASWQALYRLLSGHHPYSWSAYSGASTDRHNREYTITELERLLKNAGYDVAHAETFYFTPLSWKEKLLAAWLSLPSWVRGKQGLQLHRMGPGSLVVGKKVAHVQERYPGWLYYTP